MKFAPRLLLVDDEPINLVILEEYLGGAGYRLVKAENGEMAWRILAQDREGFQAVLLDRMMPDMDGLAILRRMKQDPRLKDVPVIFQTAAGDRDRIAEGLRQGAYYYLVKPFDRAVLTAIVNAAVEDGQRVRRLLDALDTVTLGWRLVEGASFTFRTPDEADHMASLLARLAPDPEKAVVGFFELLLNAVEHGNLGITYAEKSALILEDRLRDELERRLADPVRGARRARVDLTRQGKQRVLSITDQGGGFDWRHYLAFDPNRAAHPHGRGIAMACSLDFGKVEYQEPGNVVKVTLGG
ncbi:MAG: response regulator [Spirochaetes bacterium]|nr:response regulator [Spirochaetota bacterium]